MKQGGRVIVGLSGGVDSSVAAALLLERGYAVEGAFIVPWSPEWLPCTWREERLDAMRVAAHLKIPFHTVDLSKEYERDVAQYFIREYSAGRTPNPDVMCNKHIKFGAFFDWALGQGFDYVATGHYARVQSTARDFKVQSAKCEDADAPSSDNYMLFTGIDTNKDQSYFLWTLTQQHLERTLFPIGDFQKTEVRQIAARFGLPTAIKKDSQGICFLGKVDMKEFLTHYIQTVPGNVLNLGGEVVGHHNGAQLYTLGERHGFTITKKTPHDGPLYVVAKDMQANTISVSERLPTVPQSDRIILSDVNWISGHPPIKSVAPSSLYRARFRYRQPLFPAQVHVLGPTTTHIKPFEGQCYVNAGQSLVLYDDTVCVGGGIISEDHAG